MPRSTPSTPKPLEPKLFLFIGPPGGGKTHTAMQFPHVSIVDTERNLDGAEAINRKLIPDLEYDYETVTFKADGSPVSNEDVYQKTVDAVVSKGKDPWVKTVVVDNLSHLNEYVVQKVLKDQGSKTLMEPQYWNPFKSYFVSLLMPKLRGTGKTVICTIHEKELYKPKKGAMFEEELIGYAPCIQSDLKNNLAGYFTDMWRFTQAAQPGGKKSFFIETSSNGLIELKCSIPGMPTKIEIKENEKVWDKLAPYLKGLV